MLVEVAFVPALVVKPERRVCVVVDVLRASTTLVAMFEAGARRVRVATGPEEALAIAAADRSRFWVCGEVGGLPPPGFDYGNSPRELERAPLAEREIVFSTSNGTRALRAVAAAPLVLVATIRNARAAANRALSEAVVRGLDLAIVCSGEAHGTRVALEDVFCAGYLAELIAGRGELGEPALADSATIARRLYRSFLAPGADPCRPTRQAALAAFDAARHARDLVGLGLGADLQYCAEPDVSSIVPRLERAGEALVVGPR